MQGHPVEALALAANDLARRGHSIKPGWIVLTGGMTDAVFAPPGVSIGIHFTNLGSCCARPATHFAADDVTLAERQGEPDPRT